MGFNELSIVIHDACREMYEGHTRAETEVLIEYFYDFHKKQIELLEKENSRLIGIIEMKEANKILLDALEHYASPDYNEIGNSIIKDSTVAIEALKEIRNINGNNN